MTIEETIKSNEIPKHVTTTGQTLGHVLPTPHPKTPQPKKSEMAK